MYTKHKNNSKNWKTQIIFRCVIVLCDQGCICRLSKKGMEDEERIVGESYQEGGSEQVVK